MMKSSFLIVADRGNVKAYRLEKVIPGRPPRVQLVQALTLVEPHQRLSETVSDQAGAFSGGEGMAGGSARMRHPNGIAERHLELERDRRVIKQLASHISTILRQEQPGFWAFAAPTEIHHAVIAELPTDFRELIEENLAADLVKVPPERLLSHFSAAGVGA